MSFINTTHSIANISRDQKEQYIKKYFAPLKDEKEGKMESGLPLSSIVFSSTTTIGGISLKFIGATVFLKEFRSVDYGKTAKKDRAFFFVFIEGDKKGYKFAEYETELYDLCSYFAKVATIKVVFYFTTSNDYTVYGYSSTGSFRINYGKEGRPNLNENFQYINRPNEYINELIDHRKYLEDCFLAYVGGDDGGLRFIDNDYFDTRLYFNSIVHAINEGKKLIFVNGPAGSGKTILAMRLLGLYKEAHMLIINEYFHSELESIFNEKNEAVRFFNHRGSDSEEVIKNISIANEYKIPLTTFAKRFNSFLYNKYWQAWSEEHSESKPGAKFWEHMRDTEREGYKEDFEMFAEQEKQNNYVPVSIFIIDEGQRIYQRTIKRAYDEKLITIIFGDPQQKINPDTDDLEVNAKTGLDFKGAGYREEDILVVNLQYPIRISENALEKINYILEIENTRKYGGTKEAYPITICDNALEFMAAFRADREKQKFIASYQDAYKFDVIREKSTTATVKQVRFLDKVILFEFTDNKQMYLAKQAAYELSDKLGVKIVNMQGHKLNVSQHHKHRDRYRLANDFDYEFDDEYKKGNTLLELESTLTTISPIEKRRSKGELLFNPDFKSRIFSPYELISREVRSIYIYLPSLIQIKGDQLVDVSPDGQRFVDGDNDYLLNQIYVLMTRATRKIHLFAEDKQVRDHFHTKLAQYDRGDALSLFD